jgi:hypothetical protein
MATFRKPPQEFENGAADARVEESFDPSNAEPLRGSPRCDARGGQTAARARRAGAGGTEWTSIAVAIARSRLTLSFLQKAGLDGLVAAPRPPLNVVVADSLIYGARGVTRDFADIAESKRE